MYNENEWHLEHAPFVKTWITFPVLNVITQMPPVTYPERSICPQIPPLEMLMFHLWFVRKGIRC